MMLRLGLLSVFALLAACVPQPATNDLTVVDMAGQNTACKEGATKSCACVGGTTSGQKTCGSDGKYGDCKPCTGGTTTDPSKSSNPGNSSGTTPTTGTSKCGTCSGCCDMKTMKCVELAAETDAACGIKGKTCSACGTGTTCDTSSGKCTKPATGGTSCNSSCDGCCSPTDGCVTYQDTDSFACGVNGSTCKACDVVGGLCDDAGMCTNKVAYYSYYQISIRNIDASGTACRTRSGDIFASPDPMVCLVGWDPTNNVILKDFDGKDIVGCSAYCSSTGNCSLTTQQGIVTSKQSDGTYAPVEFPGDAIDNTNGVILAYVYDYDTNTSDLLGSGNLPAVTILAPGTLISGGPYDVQNPTVPCMVPIKFEVSYDFSQ